MKQFLPFDIVVDHYIDQTEAEFLLLTGSEQKLKLEEKKMILERKRELS
jgi:hypothetical protein